MFAKLRLVEYICKVRETNSMKIRFLTIVSLTLIAIANSINVNSQTCRIKSSTSNTGSPVYTKVYESDYVDDKPEFPGGSTSLINFINSHRQYPQEAYDLGIEGRVTCAFVVNPDGKISHIKVLKGVESSLNKEAVRLVSIMPDWEPGKINDQPVPVRVVYCIPFRK